MSTIRVHFEWPDINKTQDFFDVEGESVESAMTIIDQMLRQREATIQQIELINSPEQKQNHRVLF